MSKSCTTFTTDVSDIRCLLTPLLHCVVDDTLVKAFPLLRNVLLQLLYSPDLVPVDSLHTPRARLLITVSLVMMMFRDGQNPHLRENTMG